MKSQAQWERGKWVPESLRGGPATLSRRRVCWSFRAPAPGGCEAGPRSATCCFLHAGLRLQGPGGALPDAPRREGSWAGGGLSLDRRSTGLTGTGRCWVGGRGGGGGAPGDVRAGGRQPRRLPKPQLCFALEGCHRLGDHTLIGLCTSNPQNTAFPQDGLRGAVHARSSVSMLDDSALLVLEKVTKTIGGPAGESRCRRSRPSWLRRRDRTRLHRSVAPPGPRVSLQPLRDASARK